MMAIYEKHFEAEEALFTTIRDNKHDIADHRHRHLGLMNTVKDAQLSISEEMTEYIKNWLAQHIKNTDFTYRRLLPVVHPVPTPFKWNEDHKELFSCLADVEANSSDEAILESCRKSYADHFKAETDQLALSTTYPKKELHQHINNHNILLHSMGGLTTPIPRSGLTLPRTGSLSISPTPISDIRTRCPTLLLTPMPGTNPLKSFTRDSMMSTLCSLTSCSS